MFGGEYGGIYPLCCNPGLDVGRRADVQTVGVMIGPSDLVGPLSDLKTSKSSRSVRSEKICCHSEAWSKRRVNWNYSCNAAAT